MWRMAAGMGLIRGLHSPVMKGACGRQVLTDRGPGSTMSSKLNYADLAQRLVDLERLIHPPPVGERAGLASSYDRASIYDSATDRYLHWGANNDGGGVVRMEGEDAVLAEIEGPGCIWRIWSATVGEGHVRIFLDGAETPAVDLPFSGYFDRQHAPFTRPQLVYKTAAEGYNNYTPIPFQRSCRIVAAPQWGKYYHINFTRFAPGTCVPTFACQLDAAAEAALDRANAIFDRAGEAPQLLPDGATEVRGLLSLPGRTSGMLTRLRGPRAIRAIRVRVELPADVETQRRRLRELTVQIRWDDETAPSVWSPLGDFFGCAAGAVPFRTLPVGLRENGTFYCYWPMPFASTAEIIVSNDGAAPATLEWQIEHAPLPTAADALLHFHAKWHGNIAPVRADRAPDWTLLRTEGAGRYVGTQLHVWNPRGGWWGEGDEKFFVDGEKFPSVFGTGTEDYLGYAWSSKETFVQALHSQPVNQQNRGHVSANRWHVPDDVPFQRSFEGAIEKYFPDTNPCLWAAVAYWYLTPTGGDPFGPVPVEERTGPWIHPAIWRAPDVIEAEDMPVLKEQWKFAGCPMDAVARNLPEGRVSADRFLLWWVDAVGHRLELGFSVPQSGRYRVSARFIRDHEMGVFRFDVAGVTLGTPLDLYAAVKEQPWVDETPTELGIVPLAAGACVFGVEVVGRNTASAGYLFAFDYLKLERLA